MQHRQIRVMQNINFSWFGWRNAEHIQRKQQWHDVSRHPKSSKQFLQDKLWSANSAFVYRAWANCRNSWRTIKISLAYPFRRISSTDYQKLPIKSEPWSLICHNLHIFAPYLTSFGRKSPVPGNFHGTIPPTSFYQPPGRSQKDSNDLQYSWSGSFQNCFDTDKD